MCLKRIFARFHIAFRPLFDTTRAGTRSRRATPVARKRNPIASHARERCSRRTTPVARETQPYRATRAGTLFQTYAAGRAGAQPYRATRAGTLFQTCDAGRAGAQPYRATRAGTLFQTYAAGRAGAQPYRATRAGTFSKTYNAGRAERNPRVHARNVFQTYDAGRAVARNPTESHARERCSRRATPVAQERNPAASGGKVRSLCLLKNPATRRAGARGSLRPSPSPVWRTPEDRQPAVETYRSGSEPRASAPETPRPSLRLSVPW